MSWLKILVRVGKWMPGATGVGEIRIIGVEENREMVKGCKLSLTR